MAEVDPYMKGREAYRKFVETSVEQRNPYAFNSDWHELWALGYDDAHSDKDRQLASGEKAFYDSLTKTRYSHPKKGRGRRPKTGLP